jgi:hypothetical protein
MTSTVALPNTATTSNTILTTPFTYAPDCLTNWMLTDFQYYVTIDSHDTPTSLNLAKRLDRLTSSCSPTSNGDQAWSSYDAKVCPVGFTVASILGPATYPVRQTECVIRAVNTYTEADIAFGGSTYIYTTTYTDYNCVISTTASMTLTEAYCCQR